MNLVEIKNGAATVVLHEVDCRMLAKICEEVEISPKFADPAVMSMGAAFAAMEIAIELQNHSVQKSKDK